MIHGAHAIIYSKDPDADRAFLGDVRQPNHARPENLRPDEL